MITENIARAIGIRQNSDDAWQTAGQGIRGADDQQVVSENALEALPVRRILCTQTEIHDIHAVIATPFECAKDHIDVRA